MNEATAATPTPATSPVPRNRHWLKRTAFSVLGILAIAVVGYAGYLIYNTNVVQVGVTKVKLDCVTVAECNAQAQVLVNRLADDAAARLGKLRTDKVVIVDKSAADSNLVVVPPKDDKVVIVDKPSPAPIYVPPGTKVDNLVTATSGDVHNLPAGWGLSKN